MSKWKIWYTDYELEGNSIQEWIDSPTEGVVAVYEFFGVTPEGHLLGRCSLGSDWYWMTESGEVQINNDSADEPDVWLPVDLPPNVHVKKGKWVSNERMKQVNDEIDDMIGRKWLENIS
jgi:hypothetical protein